ncbi:unnamed protein product [Cuscuta campestris]|uniref:Pectin acetylesterase n=1 Tax=Cuscuta campestris TaxID=132261 RepID=A0A484NCN5_9ASTE|nr:unnamed protein product [Cuscuta campestris]
MPYGLFPDQFLVCAFFSMAICLQQFRVSSKLHILESAKVEGAVCLNGSSLAYDWEVAKDDANRTGDHSIECCRSRATIDLGSYCHMNVSLFKHIFSGHSNDTFFYSWNRVIVRYYDRGSFAGDVDKPDPNTKLYYRGARIFRIVIRDLMARVIKDSSNILLAERLMGVMIHCNGFRCMFSAGVKCLADSSLFLHMKDPVRAKFFNTIFGTMVGMQRPDAALPTRCTLKKSAKTCFFQQNLVRYIGSLLFIVDPAFDSFQVRHVFH